MSETQPTTTRFTAKVITFSAIALALATVIATFVKFKGPFWFNGGSITLFSMLIICMIGYWYGPAIGLTAAFAYSILQFITGPYVMHPAQVILDYPLAFTSLGLSGFFYKKKNGLLYVATDTGLVVLDENGTTVQMPISELLSAARVRAVKEDREGNLWFCCFDVSALVRLGTAVLGNGRRGGKGEG